MSDNIQGIIQGVAQIRLPVVCYNLVPVATESVRNPDGSSLNSMINLGGFDWTVSKYLFSDNYTRVIRTIDNGQIRTSQIVFKVPTICAMDAAGNYHHELLKVNKLHTEITDANGCGLQLPQGCKFVQFVPGFAAEIQGGVVRWYRINRVVVP